MDRLTVVKLGTRGAASPKKPLNSRRHIPRGWTQILKRESKILLDLFVEKMKICEDQEGRENLSIFYDVPRKRKPIVPWTNALQRMAPNLGISWKSSRAYR
jgi:hypothetical protein